MIQDYSMDSVRSPMKPPLTADETCQNARACLDKEDDGDPDRCSYEKQRDKRVAKMKEMLRPVQKTSKEL